MNTHHMFATILVCERCMHAEGIELESFHHRIFLILNHFDKPNEKSMEK